MVFQNYLKIDGVYCLLMIKAKKKRLKFLKSFGSLGSKVKLMNFKDHDYVLSLTSHMPHAVAYSIVKTAINNDDKFKNDIIQYSAGGF